MLDIGASLSQWCSRILDVASFESSSDLVDTILRLQGPYAIPGSSTQQFLQSMTHIDAHENCGVELPLRRGRDAGTSPWVRSTMPAVLHSANWQMDPEP
ncbi:hypothetical protein SPRG_15588 [Saprolegnia parasitica CBS 223.65]|uniref:Uncharacterized protein n=1 Tax=Saprolegnia parasitica (strain CBS 223.65) TaxID=695850 RepID=A0A067BVU3_SAPPC|nr:hypothetical protein SPRG_15588 [Saprolegnia parasitica CBS 223.65]KDO18421.1 hypothetical protein SPRG_15588 [Saprolegnia parasitica CBS 223.65]|eukprot:XP_012210871.1 hypothetical protein SPRG_15588 [Saprolegnia parasitica CBS 223.65]